MRRILCKYKARSLIVIVNVNCYESSAQSLSASHVCRLQRTHKNWNDTSGQRAFHASNNNNEKKIKTKTKINQNDTKRSVCRPNEDSHMD